MGTDSSFDLVVRGGRVVDGTGVPAYLADVGVRDGRVARVGRISAAELASAGRVLDVEGHTVMPGFVDIHTHYDAQLHFEPTASPSSWHGVTTVVIGNTGFGLAPSKPDDMEWLARSLAQVEGMRAESLLEGVTFTGGSTK